MIKTSVSRVRLHSIASRDFKPAHIHRTYPKATRGFISSRNVKMAANGTEKETTVEAVAHGEQTLPPSAYDFRSDTVTTPTPAMLQSILSIPIHGDDVFSEDTTTNDLEKYIVSITGKPAACFVMSGTMGNQVSMRAHLTQPPHSIVCDFRSHVFNYEAGGAAVLSQAQFIPALPKRGMHLTLEDIREKAVVDDDIHYAQTRLICLENSLHGTIMPLDEIKRISIWARENGIKMHLDGARLWNVVAAGGGELKEIVSNFDSVALCFSKGLGAPMGSIVIGETDFIKRVRHFRKMLGGATRQIGIATAPARTAIEEVFFGGKLKRSHELAKKLEKAWTSHGGKLKYPCDTNMVWLDVEGAGVDWDEIKEELEKANVKWLGDRIVVHHQICDEAIEKVQGIFAILMDKAKARGGVQSQKENKGMYSR